MPPRRPICPHGARPLSPISMHLLKTRGDFTAAARDAKPEPNQVRLPATAFSRRPRASRPSLCAPGARAPPPAQASLPVRPASRMTPCVGDIGLSSVRRVGVGSTGASATAPACGQRLRAARIEQSVQRTRSPHGAACANPLPEKTPMQGGRQMTGPAPEPLPSEDLLAARPRLLPLAPFVLSVSLRSA